MTTTQKQKQKTAIELADEELLASLGYKQEFQRAFTGLEVSDRYVAAKSLVAPVMLREHLRYWRAVGLNSSVLSVVSCQTFGIAFSIIGLLPSIA